MADQPLRDADTVRMDDEVRTGVYGRVPDELGEPLTAEEVASLAHGTEVVIIWSGGNGPHHYWIWRTPDGMAYARSDSEDEGEFLRLSLWKDPISFVGNQRFHTRVWAALIDGRDDG